MLRDAKSEHQRHLDGIEALQAQMTFRVSVLSKLLDQQMAQLASEVDLSLGAYRALATIEAFGQLTAADLARYTAYDKGAVSRQVGELSAGGLIRVIPDPGHGRRKILSLTPEGMDRLLAIRPKVEARRANLSAVLGPDEEQAFLNAIEKLGTYMSAKPAADTAA